MNLTIVRSAEKEIAKLTPPTIGRILDKLENLEIKAFPRGYKKLKGFVGLYRIRVADYRIVYSVEGENIVVLRVRHRKKVYEGI